MFGRGIPSNLSGLYNERIQLRLLERSDEERLWSILSDQQVFLSIANAKDDTYYQKRKLLGQILSRDVEQHLHLGICLAQEGYLIGFVSLQNYSSFRSMPLLGYMLDRLYWGQGLTTEAVSILMNFGFSELGLQKVEGRCREDNIASEKVMRKNGFVWDRMLPQRYGADLVTNKINIFHLDACNHIVRI
ncbi:GNAT family N-acetyltransferase [Paenibacillus sp. CMAA1364]